MKTICNWDNVACLVDNLANTMQGAFLGGAIVGLALIGAYIFASVAKGN